MLCHEALTKGTPVRELLRQAHPTSRGMRAFVTEAVAAASTLGAGLCFVLTTSVPTVGAATYQPYSGSARDAASSPAGPYVGVQNITIGGTPYAAPAVTTVLAPLTPEGNSGVLRTTTGHEITLPSGTITTIDKAHLIPTDRPGVYKLASRLVILTLTASDTIAGTVCGLD